MRISYAVLALLTLAATAVAGEDLGKRYPATLDWSQDAQGLDCTSSPEDVWKLKSFEFAKGKKLAIKLKSSNVVLGRKGTDVLWAVVVPDKPAKLVSSIAGNGEHVRSIFMRFHGGSVGRLFPKKTVKGNGPERLIPKAQRIQAHKIAWRWAAGQRPVPVPRSSVILDFETEEGPRRTFLVELSSGSVTYEESFASQPLPAETPIEKKAALAAFDEVWGAFDHGDHGKSESEDSGERGYAGFGLLPDLDWDAVGKRFRKEAEDVRTTHDLGGVLARMLAKLEDLHVWVKVGEDFIPGYFRDRPLNGNWGASEGLIGGCKPAGDNLTWGRTDDDVGYLNVYGLSDPELPQHFDAALEKLADTTALVIDLRWNGGGGEDLALAVAGRFLDETRIYSVNQYRNGPEHDDLCDKLQRPAEPRGPWRYQAPVIVLQGQKAMSSAESLVLMLAQCPQVTTLGDKTAGSSANPRHLELGCGITVNQPRWLDMDPDGNPIEHVGVAPDVQLDFEEGAFDDTHDPVLAAALERLRALPKLERAPGRR